MSHLKGRVGLVTGASRGIGRATALALARSGVQLIAIARKEKDLERLDDDVRAVSGKPASLVPLDLTDLEGIDRLASVIGHRYGKLDLLISAAAELGKLEPLAMQTPKDFERITKVNLTANHRMIAAFDGLLRASGQEEAGADAVFFSSGVVQRPRAHWGAYQASKAGLAAMAVGYREEVRTFGVRVHLFDPGATATDMRRAAYPGEDKGRLKTPDDVAEDLLQRIGRDPEAGAEAA